jgi:hypothetical protein
MVTILDTKWLLGVSRQKSTRIPSEKLIYDQTMTFIKPIPEGYHTVAPYILARGADKLIDFMKKLLTLKKLSAI